MFAVAVTRTRGLVRPDQGYRASPSSAEPTREELAGVLAALTGQNAADWRMRIGQPLPWIVAMSPDAAHAEALVAALRAHGLVAVSCDSTTIRPWTPRGRATLVLHEDNFGFVDAARLVDYAAVRVAVLATVDSETSTEEVDQVRVSVNPRNFQQTMPVSRYHRERSRSRALFLVLGGDEPDIRLAQGSLRLEQVGPSGRVRMPSTAIEGFQRATDALLARLSGAIRDDRLLTARRSRNSFSTGADGVTHTTSNARETDLVAHLIGLAWMEAQIDPAES